MADWRPGPRNLLTDVAGLTVGNASDPSLASGVTAILCETPCVAAVDVRGGAPGTRETDLLAPENTVREIDALVLSGGSAFGLDAASGVQALLRERGRGFAVGAFRVPIVPAAILFDLANGGDKGWGRYPPYRELGYGAAAEAGPDFELGSVGAGTGCATASVKGGLGAASTVLRDGITVAALVAVNALGSPTIGGGRHFWGAPFEIGEEFGGLGLPHPFPQDATIPRTKLNAVPGANTTIGVIATDALLDKAGAKRLAGAAQDGLARALWPAHTDLDGDLVFALATGARILDGGAGDAARIELAAAATATMTRAIARAIFTARRAEGDFRPTWAEL